MRKREIILLLILNLYFLFSSILYSANLYVGPAQKYSTFESAFNDAQTGDYIIICETQAIKTYEFLDSSPPINGWTWLSFDILNVEPQDNIASELLDPIKDFSLLDYALFKDHGPNTFPQRIEYLGEELWLNGDHPITSPYGYKFCTFNDCHLTIFGERCESTTTFELAG